MFYEIGYDVKRLVRTRIGHLRLGDLPRGHLAQPNDKRNDRAPRAGCGDDEARTFA